jgi:hypothetical protein
VKAETGSEISAQDQALQTNYRATKILQTETAHADNVNNGTVDHTVSACPILAKEQYIKRHDRVCAQLQFNVYKEVGIKLDNEHWCELVPKLVGTGLEGKVTVLWNQQVQTLRTIPNNKPDIVTRDNEKGTCRLIDVAISGDRSVIKTEAEKIFKNKVLTTEIQLIWNVTTKLVPEITGADHL